MHSAMKLAVVAPHQKSFDEKTQETFAFSSKKPVRAGAAPHRRQAPRDGRSGASVQLLDPQGAVCHRDLLKELMLAPFGGLLCAVERNVAQIHRIQQTLTNGTQNSTGYRQYVVEFPGF